MHKGLRIQDVRDLRKTLVAARPEAAERLADALRQPIGSPGALRELHDLALFAEAYPGNAAIRILAGRLLEKVRQWVIERRAPGTGTLDTLQDSGITGCDCVGSYSLTLVRWLLRSWQGCVELFSIDAPLEEALALLRPILPPVEREAIDLPCTDTAELTRNLFGDSSIDQLTSLVRLFDSAIPDEMLREALFARLQVFVRIDGAAEGFSLTDARGEPAAAHVHDHGLQRNVDAGGAWDQPLGAPIRLNKNQESALIRSARIALALMQRETDPITYANAAELFDMGRGLRIALFHMDTEHRLVFESYVGFMAFKNGVPMGYGGAWIFPGRSKVGINVFPALRGGESAWFFAQLLRLYRQRFRVGVFEAENYQLGHGNPDGLKSGAYWFYYRLGFRPWSRELGRIVAREFERMQQRKGYQPPLRVMKELVADGLVLRIADEGLPLIDTAALVLAAQRLAAQDPALRLAESMGSAEANACAAFGLSRRDLASPGVAAALRAWALPLRLIGDCQEWPSIERNRIGRSLRAKAARTEDAYQAALRDCRKLLEAWAAASAPR